MFELSDKEPVSTATIKVIGIGGAGGNAVNTMISYNLRGVDFIAANTDAQALEASSSPVKIQLGAEVTKGLGAGSDPDIGRQAALETRETLREHTRGIRHGLHHRGTRRRNGNRRRADRGGNRQGNRGADGGGRDETLPVRGEKAKRPGGERESPNCERSSTR